MGNPAVVVDFVANTKDLQRGFGRASGASSGFGAKLKSLGKAGLVGAAAAGVAGLTAAVKIGISEFQDAQKVTAQTNAVIKSTGKSAGVTTKQVQDLAGALMKKSGVDDEAIQSGENLLLTFTKVQNQAGKGNDIFNQATKVMLDMSTALGQDMKSSAIQLGKALNDPIKGITALSRVGVSFTKQQKDQIKTLVEHGKTVKAQKIILAELNKEFGGSAAAAGKTLPGQLNILKQSFNNLAGDIVGKVVPYLTQGLKVLRDNWPQIAAAAKQMWAVLGPLLGALAALVVQVAKIVIDNWKTIGPVFLAQARIFMAAAKVITIAVKLVTAVLRGDWAGAWKQAKALMASILNLMVAIARAAFTQIKTVISVALAAVRALVGAAVAGMKAAWSAGLNVMKSVTNNAWNAIKGAVNSAIGAVKKALQGLGSWISGFAHGALTGALNACRAVFGRITDGAQNAVAGVRNAMNSIVRVIDSVIGRVRGAANSVANAIKAPVNAVLRAWNSVSLTVPRISIPKIKIGPKTFGGGGFGGQTIGFPDVPLLASGGVVTSPTLAMVGEQGTEIVAPEKLLRDIVGDREVHVRVFIGSTELKDMVRTEIVDSNTGIARALLAG